MSIFPPTIHSLPCSYATHPSAYLLPHIIFCINHTLHGISHLFNLYHITYHIHMLLHVMHKGLKVCSIASLLYSTTNLPSLLLHILPRPIANFSSDILVSFYKFPYYHTLYSYYYYLTPLIPILSSSPIATFTHHFYILLINVFLFITNCLFLCSPYIGVFLKLFLFLNVLL